MVQGWKFEVVALTGHCGVCGSRLKYPGSIGYCSMLCLVDAERMKLILNGWKCDSYMSVDALMDARKSFDQPPSSATGG